MSRRRAPRPASVALQAVLRQTAPQTSLAAVQAVWAETAGEAIAASARPLAERDGAVVVECSDPVWAQELDLMQERLLAALRDQLGERAPARLQFRAELR